MRLLCLGDSLTFGFGLPRSGIWPVLAARETGLELVSWAVNGCTTGGMLALFPPGGGGGQARPGLPGPPGVRYGPDPGHRCAAGALSPGPAGLGRLCRLNEVGRLGAEYAGWLHGLCAAFGFPMIDFSACLLEAARRAGSPLRDLYLPDGLHPNRAGHRHMADTAAPILAALAAKADR